MRRLAWVLAVGGLAAILSGCGEEFRNGSGGAGGSSSTVSSTSGMGGSTSMVSSASGMGGAAAVACTAGSIDQDIVPQFYSNLDSVEDIVMPTIGLGGTTTASLEAFVPGVLGNGLLLDQDNLRLEYQGTPEAFGPKGAVDFCFLSREEFENEDTQHFFTISSDALPVLSFRKVGASIRAAQLMVLVGDHEITFSNVQAFEKDIWSRITLSWDFDADSLKLYRDGFLLDERRGAINGSVVPKPLNFAMTVGDQGGSVDTSPKGVVDEFYQFNSAITPL